MSDPLAQPSSAKPKMLIVDDEPDNLDLLYRTFRQDFQVLRAQNGQEALTVLAEMGEVAVIISDQRMPKMKGTEFLSQTIPQFPQTVRIILTGFTEAEDLVEAINTGRVHRYITKPWDPDDLRRMVQQMLLADPQPMADTQAAQIARHRHLYQMVLEVANMAPTVEAALGALLRSLLSTFNATAGCAQRVALGHPLQVCDSIHRTAPLLPDPALLQSVITHRILSYHPAPGSSETNGRSAPSSQNWGALLILPAVHRDQVLALITLAWTEPHPLTSDDLTFLEVMVGELGLILAYLEKVS